MIYMLNKTKNIDLLFSEKEFKAFSCNLIVNVDLQPSVDNDILSDWIVDLGHGGGYNNRISQRAWWLDKEDLVEVEVSKI
jgi:hypothetical protein